MTFYAPMDEGTYQGTLHVTADEPYGPEVRIPLVLESGYAAPADLSTSTKQVSPETAAPGELLDYTITLINTGDLSTSTAMTDTMPAQVEYVAGSLVASAGTAVYDPDDDAIYWNGEVGPTPVTITFQAEVRESAVHGEEALNVAVIVYEDQQLEREATVLISLGDYLNWLPLMKKP